jgi:meso-butanediol dehydrogenase / (S,S)-butanediol dehydrogenase / diacetyl reductase
MFNATAGSALMQRLQRAGQRSVFVPTDASVEAEMQHLFEVAESTLGGVDAIVNVAGVLVTREITSLTTEDWDRLQAVNVKSCFLSAKFGVPLLRAAGGGAIVFTSSVGVFALELARRPIPPRRAQSLH